MKRCLCLYVVMSMLTFCAAAQVSMTVQLPPAGVLQKAQLWNIVLVSASDRAENVMITMRLMDAQTNQPVLTGITRTILLNKGAKQLRIGDVMPVQYEYLSAAIDRSVSGMLPAGSYMACYSLMVLSDKNGNQPGEDCIPFAVEPVSPPLLNTPANESVLESGSPQFTWLPPAPLNMFNDLNYELTLVEVHPGQSPLEAIQQNIPVYRAPRLKNIFVNYPAGALTLDTARQYAWTVVARNGSLFAAQTEIWTFRLKAVHKPVYAAGNGAYVQLRKELDGTVISCSSLRFEYNNETADSTVRYEVIALENNNRIVSTGALSVKRGPNNLELPLKKGFGEGRSYLFRLRNVRNEYWQVKFIYIREDQL